MTRSCRPPPILVASWVGLLALLALTVFVAYLPLGTANTVVAVTIATAKAMIVATVFMELRERQPLIIPFASAGLFWLAIMLWLVFVDYVTRPNFPAAG
jgi:cytochrome c oxidase subunit 4